MTVLKELAASDAPTVMELISAHLPSLTITDGSWDNRPTWDNWRKGAAPFDNRPTWDNWDKKKNKK